jgi:hypothetical protein
MAKYFAIPGGWTFGSGGVSPADALAREFAAKVRTPEQFHAFAAAAPDEGVPPNVVPPPADDDCAKAAKFASALAARKPGETVLQCARRDPEGAAAWEATERERRENVALKAEIAARQLHATKGGSK